MRCAPVVAALLLVLLAPLGGTAQTLPRGLFPAHLFVQAGEGEPTQHWDWPDESGFRSLWAEEARAPRVAVGTLRALGPEWTMERALAAGPERLRSAEGQSLRSAVDEWFEVDGLREARRAQLEAPLPVTLGMEEGSFFPLWTDYSAEGSTARLLLSGATLASPWPAASATEAELVLSGPEGEVLLLSLEALSIEVGAEHPPQGRAWADWVYATGLMRSPLPVYQPWEQRLSQEELEAGEAVWGAAAEQMPDLVNPWEREGTDREVPELSAERQLELLEGLLEAPIGSGDHRWAAASKRAEAAGDLDLAVRFRSWYRPMGSCSMDETPRLAALDYADLCHRAGRTGCFLQLSTQVMGDRFARVSDGSYAWRQRGSHVERLADTGLDLERFLGGLMLYYEIDEPRQMEVGPWRLARAMRDAGLEDGMGAQLERQIGDPELDEYNRYRALLTRYYLATESLTERLGERPRGAEEAAWRARWDEGHLEILAELSARPDLPAVGASWLAFQREVN